jgi:hypothetical protein
MRALQRPVLGDDRARPPKPAPRCRALDVMQTRVGAPGPSLTSYARWQEVGGADDRPSIRTCVPSLSPSAEMLMT